ncbi:MAG: M48 family metalloprotease [Planctomycetota bacterium]|nr:M48 family metalloprotease [Planctomycetota bacterium]
MRPLLSRLVPLFAALLFLVPAAVEAAPLDAKPGDTRTIFSRRGTPLRAKPSTLGQPVATLKYGTMVKVLEVKRPWLRVQAGSTSGWLRAWETVEPSALRANAKPPHLTTTGSSGATKRELSAAGRQLDGGTERRYRATRKDLVAAYRAVDAMEAATAALHPAEALQFVDEGNLGRLGRDYTRPGRVRAQPTPRRSSGRPSGAGGLLGRLGGEAARRLGAGRTGSKVAETLISNATDYVEQVKVKFTPQQEYFLGRAVAAQAIAKYGVDPDPERRRYVRLVGEAVVRLSNRIPANFGGYHFEVLDSDDVNGVSGPGGFVLITRGAVKAARSEAELAGILAHELAHIRLQHGEKLLRQSKQFPAFVKGLAGVAGAAAGAGSGWTQGLVRFFGQIASQVGTTAIDRGYGKQLEYAADKEGTYLLFDVFYDHNALVQFVSRELTGRRASGHHGTHPPAASRVAAMQAVIAPLRAYNPPPKMLVPQQTRFAAVVSR